ncbi:uncharacterized protein LOC118278781 isoform X2 [Spodoptera frugiperda]|uniref:Uncharacterized protein LOC118278781 isoform X2 n=1 Tax=Spodoptera frugiperda TaxID=7108 RepID=A0A9R0E561_SPOFR|nr:uncharacterized protein LOC118278781 isoform X2 [Spodoptera frugiperda]
MDKKNKKKTVIKRKSDESGEGEKKQKIMVNRKNVQEEKEKVEVVNQVVEVPVEQGQQIVHTGQLVEGNFEQPVFVNMKGEPVQLGPNTVILYEQSGNPSNFAFGGMWTMDSSGRIVMAETIYDVKGEPEEEGANFVQSNTEVTTQPVEEQPNTYQQFELSSGTQVDGQQEYEVAIIENPPAETTENPEPQVVTNEDQLVATGTGAVRWLNQKYDFVVRKLQLNYDAGVKLLHSPTGCIQCVYLTTPSMQLAFNAVPQFLCIETGIEFNSTIPTVGGTGTPSLKHNVTLFLAEDGNGKSVIVSAGISTLIGEDLTWLLDTFKSCNPAWRQVRCVVCDPTKCQQAVRTAFPSAHVTCSVWQAARAAARLCSAAGHTTQPTTHTTQPTTQPALSPHGELAARCKTYALALLRGDHTLTQLQVLKRSIIGTGAGTLRLWELLSRPNGAIAKLDSWLEADNYTNILHKGLERLVTKFQNLVRNPLQLDEFVSIFFNVANQLENDRRTFALSRLRDTETLKQSPTDTITQYAYNLMSHQTKLAQKCLDDRAGSSAAICKYGTSTQECSCLFSKVFRLPCRHILMLTTELKVKTHIPFEPRWTVQHCLFGCENLNSATTNNTGAGSFLEQVVVEAEDAPRQTMQQSAVHQVGGVRQQQYVLATAGQPATPVSQVIFCGGGVGGVSGVSNVGGGAPVITSVLSAGGAVLTPHHSLHH